MSDFEEKYDYQEIMVEDISQIYQIANDYNSFYDLPRSGRGDPGDERTYLQAFYRGQSDSSWKITPSICRDTSVDESISESGDLSIKVAIEQHDTETTIPYLHVFLDNMWDLKNCAFVRLDKPEYVPEKNSIRLSTKQKEELIYILTSESKYHWTTSIVDKNNIKIATGYEVAVQVWTDTYEENNKIQYDKNGFPVMPDYTRL